MKSKKRDLITKNLGIISQRCIFYWRLLPVSAQASVEVEDMIQEAICHVLKRSGRYRPERAKPVTFVYHTTDNFCKNILEKYSTQKRGMLLMVPLPERPPILSCNPDITYSIDAVEKVLQYAPEPCRDLLASIFNGKAPRKVSLELIEALRRAAKEQGATLADFEAVLRLV